jgi:glycine/D-amino acid oxidase-like deaminating enzyme
VAVLEAQNIARSAAGDSGLVGSGYAERIERIIDRVGKAHAKELWTLCADGVEQVRRQVFGTKAREGNPSGGLLAVSRSSGPRAFRERAQILRDEFGCDVGFWSTDQVRAAVQSPHYFQALHFPHTFRIDPLAYADRLAATAEQAGVRVYEGTPVRRIDAEGVRKRIETPSGRVRAAQIVLAGGDDLGALVPRLKDTLVSLETFTVVTAQGEEVRAAVPFQGAIAELDGDASYRVADGGRLVWSGGTATRSADPSRAAARLRADIGRTLPQVGAREITHAWSSSSAYATHRMPRIGELSPGLWLADAFGRQGLGTSTMAGFLIAGAIADGDDRWRLFSSYGLAWNGGLVGRTLLEGALRVRRARNRIADRLAPYRSPLKAEILVPTHTEAPPIVPPDEAPVVPHEPQPELERTIAPAINEPALAQAVEAAAAAPPKRGRKARPKSPAPAKRKGKPKVPVPGEILVVRKAKRRSKSKAATAGTPELPPAISGDATDVGSN